MLHTINQQPLNMTVKELKDQINGRPDEMEVILQKDVEGNGYSPLRDVEPNAVYVPKTVYYGEAYELGWSAEVAEVTEEQWEEIKKRPRVLVLSPFN